MADTRTRSYCLTINNYEESDIVRLKELKLKVRYLIYGKEVSSSGTPHLQIYIYFENAVKFSTLKKKFPTAHIEVARGSPEQNREYCSKEADFEEIGELPKQGARSDIDEVREILNSGGNMRDVVPIARSVQSIRMAEIQLKYFEKKRDWKPLVKWYWGEPGTGKSHLAFNELKDPYVCMAKSKWWEGYDGHEHVIIDDMRASFASFEELLRILDRYPYRVECKGGSRQLLAKTIIITSTFSPYNIYDTGENLVQLLRRIDEVREFTIPYYCTDKFEEEIERQAESRMDEMREDCSSDEENVVLEIQENDVL